MFLLVCLAPLALELLRFAGGGLGELASQSVQESRRLSAAHSANSTLGIHPAIGIQPVTAPPTADEFVHLEPAHAPFRVLNLTSEGMEGNASADDMINGVAEAAGRYQKGILGGVLLALIPMLIFACVYKSKVVNQWDEYEEGYIWPWSNMNDEGEFNSGVGDCCTDKPTCLHAFFCPACRAGDTFQSAGIATYWSTIGLFVAAEVIGNIIATLVLNKYPNATFCGPLTTALLLGVLFQGKRRELRDKLGGDNENKHCIKDCLCWGFCTCCVIAQEARTLDKAAGVTVECCFKVTRVDNSLMALVGEPEAWFSGIACFGGDRKCCGEP